MVGRSRNAYTSPVILTAYNFTRK